MDSDYHKIERLAAQFGLVIRGGFNTTAEDNVPAIAEDAEVRSLILFGNAGSSIWSNFSASSEYHDGLADLAGTGRDHAGLASMAHCLARRA